MFGVPVVSNSCAFFTAHEAAGAVERPAFPAPSEFRGHDDWQSSGTSCRENVICRPGENQDPLPQGEVVARMSTACSSSRDSAVWVLAFARTTAESWALPLPRTSATHAAFETTRLRPSC